MLINKIIMMGHLISFFKEGIERKRNYIPNISMRLYQKALERGENPKKPTPKGLTKEQENILLQNMRELVTERLETFKEFNLWSDYEPQGLLREIAYKSGLSASDFSSYTMLPTKLNICLTNNSIIIKSDSEILLNK
jgi:hypothetical protein